MSAASPDDGERGPQMKLTVDLKACLKSGQCIYLAPQLFEDDGTGFTRPYHLHMMHWPMTRFSFISCHVPALSLPMVRFWRARGMPVTTWTVRSQDEAERTKLGADQIVFEGFDPR